MKTKMMSIPRNLLVLATMWLCAGAFLLFSPSAKAQEKQQLTIETTANGSVELAPSLDSPVFVEFERSPVLTARMAAMLKEAGFQTVASKDGASVTITIGGDLALLGGPVFYKGAKVRIGEVAERTIAAVKAGEGAEVTNAAQNVVTVALNAAAYAGTASAVMRGLQMSRMVDAIGDQLGLKASFNTALTGDPRGWCLSRCDDWKKVSQTAYVVIKVTAGEKTQTIRVKSSAFSETLAPEQVVSAALDAAMRQLVIKDSAVAVNTTR
jgi:hypothetical protein